MNAIINNWKELSPLRKGLVAGSVLAVLIGTLILFRSAGERDMSLLYAGLDSQASGEVLTALDQAGVAYVVQGNAIMVPTALRDQMRMTLASQNLPANGTAGYELLDNLSGFGTTSQMFDAAYWRAKEGELARTMLASPHIRTARVHISATSTQPFRTQQKPTAAVTIGAAVGQVTSEQAEALRFLVASSVPGMSPADVAVIDDSAGLIPAQGSNAALASVERQAEIRERVARILSARVGAENVAVEVSVETVTASETVFERRVDPDSRVAISTDQQESSSRSEDTGRGDVTVASNLPEGDGAGNAGQSSAQNTDSRTVTNFELSETQREVQRAPGDIARITVAVLLNTVETVAADGTVTQAPRSEEELEALRQLVASAVGYDADRGDEITIQSLPFEAVSQEAGTAGEPVDGSTPLDVASLIEMGIIAAVVLALGLFVVRPALLGSRPADITLDNSGPAETSEFPDVMPPIEIAEALPSPEGLAEVDASERIKALIDARREEAVQVIQSWVEPPARGRG